MPYTKDGVNVYLQSTPGIKTYEKDNRPFTQNDPGSIIVTGPYGEGTLSGNEAQQYLSSIGANWSDLTPDVFGGGGGGTAPSSKTFAQLSSEFTSNKQRLASQQAEQKAIEASNAASNALKAASGGTFGVNEEQIKGYQSSGLTPEQYVKTLNAPVSGVTLPGGGIMSQEQYRTTGGVNPNPPANTSGTTTSSYNPNVSYQVLNVEALKRYAPGSTTTLPDGRVILNQGVQPIAGTVKEIGKINQGQEQNQEQQQGQQEQQQNQGQNQGQSDISNLEAEVNGIIDQLNAKDTTGQDKSISDVISEISSAMGLTEISDEIKKYDDQFADEVMSVNENPWLSEGIRQKKIQLLENKYESKKTALVDRLRLQENAVGKAIDYYYKEQDLKRELLYKNLDIKLKLLDRQTEIEQQAKEDLAKSAQQSTDLEKEMVLKGYTPTSSQEATKLKTQGYEIVNVGGKTYAKPQKLYKVTYKGKTTWYNELGEIVKPSAGQIASQGGSAPTSTPKPSTKTAVSEMTQAINSVTGPDGFISPQDHQTLRKQWINAGLPVGEFDKNFKDYLNPNNPNYITSKQ